MTIAEDLYTQLNSSGVTTSTGNIVFDFLNTHTRIHDRSVVGNIIQQWLEQWMTENNFVYDINPNTQEPPDFYLNPADHNKDLLEVKCFDRARSPNFDIGNFIAYCTHLKNNPAKLDSNYLIFGYTMDTNGNVSIQNLWLKKVWEICGPSGRNPIKLQVKKGVIYNIRPITWYAARSTFSAFNNAQEFLTALNSVLGTTPNGHHLYSNNWLNSVSSGYTAATGNSLT